MAAVQNSSHSPERSDTSASLRPTKIPDNPQELLHESIFPDDSYTEDGTYFADLPAIQRNKWIASQQASEAKRELKNIWQMFKRDPLSPLGMYLNNHALAGLGFFTEGYVLFSVGNVRTLFEAAFPRCWKSYEICNEIWVQSVSYLQIVGIIFGQIMIGILGDWIGRRWGLVQDATTMFLGTILLTAVWGAGGSQYGWVVGYAWSVFVFGVGKLDSRYSIYMLGTWGAKVFAVADVHGSGVGGEYPMTATSAMEGIHGNKTNREDKLHRGRSVLLAFLMQGWGQLINQAVLIILLLIFHDKLTPPYSEGVAQYTYRVSFGVVAFFLLILIYLRVWKMPNVGRAAQASKTRNNVTGYDVHSLKLVSSHYWPRLLATCLCWFANDAAFYGNRVFSNVFLSIVTTSSDQVNRVWLYNMINIGCELVGYHLAAFLIDNKHYGRKKMQAVGFLMVFILFILAAALYPELNRKGPGGKAFLFIYFFSSFWIQFGSNSTTFLLAAEIYPAPVRATAHGMSAAVGKCGALFTTVLYNYIGGRTKFWVVSWFGLIGFFLTMAFVPDSTGLDLSEQERYWACVRAGRPEEYHGIAVHPRHLSLWERFVLHRDKNYNPELDKKAKIEELRQLWAAMESNEGDKKASGAGASSETTLITSNVSSYFEWERSSRKEKAY